MRAPGVTPLQCRGSQTPNITLQMHHRLLKKHQPSSASALCSENPAPPKPPRTPMCPVLQCSSLQCRALAADMPRTSTGPSGQRGSTSTHASTCCTDGGGGLQRPSFSRCSPVHATMMPLSEQYWGGGTSSGSPADFATAARAARTPALAATPPATTRQAGATAPACAASAAQR